MHAIIMAGGSGTRFWPASRNSRPKQFLPLAGGTSLIGATVERLRGLADPASTWIVTNPPQAEGLGKVLPDFPPDQILVEPEARDTAPCIALAAATIEARDPGATMAIMPADHLIDPPEAFHAALRRGAQLAADDETLVTFGITPTHAATGFGYIELGNDLREVENAWQVLRFREKPDQATAQKFVKSKRFLWNSGIFVWTYAGLARAMQHANEELFASMSAMLEAGRSGDRQAMEAAFRSCPKTSIDYAVMERADKVAVVGADFAWDDLGSFGALGRLGKKDADGNHVRALSGFQAILHQAENCTVYGEGESTLALFGVEDLVVVQTPDATLVCPRDRAEDIKELIASIRRAGRDDLL